MSVQIKIYSSSVYLAGVVYVRFSEVTRAAEGSISCGHHTDTMAPVHTTAASCLLSHII